MIFIFEETKAGQDLAADIIRELCVTQVSGVYGLEKIINPTRLLELVDDRDPQLVILGVTTRIDPEVLDELPRKLRESSSKLEVRIFPAERPADTMTSPRTAHFIKAGVRATLRRVINEFVSKHNIREQMLRDQKPATV